VWLEEWFEGAWELAVSLNAWLVDVCALDMVLRAPLFDVRDDTVLPSYSSFTADPVFFFAHIPSRLSLNFGSPLIFEIKDLSLGRTQLWRSLLMYDPESMLIVML
jgi:hypothetical protein